MNENTIIMDDVLYRKVIVTRESQSDQSPCANNISDKFAEAGQISGLSPSVCCEVSAGGGGCLFWRCQTSVNSNVFHFHQSHTHTPCGWKHYIHPAAGTAHGIFLLFDDSALTAFNLCEVYLITLISLPRSRWEVLTYTVALPQLCAVMLLRQGHTWDRNTQASYN